MSIPEKKGSLGDVLNDYIASEPNPSHAALNRWIRRYPEYKKELTEFTVNWSLMEHLPPSAKAVEVDQETLVLRAMSIVEDRLHSLGLRKRKAKPEITNLLAEARRQGMDVQMMADRCLMSVAIVTKLARRLIDYASIPREAIERISTAIGRSAGSVEAYLNKPMTLAHYAMYRTKSVPTLPRKRENFFDAVRTDRTLDEKRRTQWLSYERRKK